METKRRDTREGKEGRTGGTYTRTGRAGKEDGLGSMEKATAEKTRPLCFRLSLCNLLTSQAGSGSKSPDSQSTQT